MIQYDDDIRIGSNKINLNNLILICRKSRSVTEGSLRTDNGEIGHYARRNTSCY